jgi:hypothetical protein
MQEFLFAAIGQRLSLTIFEDEERIRLGTILIVLSIMALWVVLPQWPPSREWV